MLNKPSSSVVLRATYVYTTRICSSFMVHTQPELRDSPQIFLDGTSI